MRQAQPNLRRLSRFDFGWGGIVIDDATWQAPVHGEMSDWDHKRLPGRG